jgi:hypothetical protein
MKRTLAKSDIEINVEVARGNGAKGPGNTSACDKWLDWRGADAGIQFEEVIAWAKLSRPFYP